MQEQKVIILSVLQSKSSKIAWFKEILFVQGKNLHFWLSIKDQTHLSNWVN